MNIKNLISDYVFYSRYSQIVTETRDGKTFYKRENWDQAVDRVQNLHREKLRRLGIAEKLFSDPFFRDAWEQAFSFYRDKKVLGSQRVLQFGNERLFERETKVYNCAASYLDRIDFFQELTYLLLCGCGCGYSVQSCHTSKLPEVVGTREKKITFIIPDNVEGWAEAVGFLIKSYYNGTERPVFDYSLIRPAGAPINSGQFKAPGPGSLRTCLNKIEALLRNVKDRKLTNFELHRIACLIADCVIAGGVRRSALITLFDVWDNEMKTCKTGDWYSMYPELARCNNSAALLPNTYKKQFTELKTLIKQFGEPGIIMQTNENYVFNPCCEVSMYPQIDGKSGWGFCNLVEINGAASKNEDIFFEQCQAAAFLATLQALYTNFRTPLTETTIRIAQRDSLLGVSMTGMADNPKLLFNPDIQSAGANLVKSTNQRLVDLIDLPILNYAARTTTIKPSGNSAQLLGTASGIHSYHFPRYIRYIQANTIEDSLRKIKEVFPDAVQPAFIGTEAIAFPTELPEGVLVQEDSCIPFLNRIALTKANWIRCGKSSLNEENELRPDLQMNVSCTVQVGSKEWDECFDYVWENRASFGGISFLPRTGDLEYRQSPYTSVLYEDELVQRYGRGIIFSSGLITDSQSIFRDIHEACDAALGRDKRLLTLTDEEISTFITSHIKNGQFLVDLGGLMVSDVNAIIKHLRRQVDLRNDWVRRFKKFAKNYFEEDLLKTSHALKHVNNLHYWQRLQVWPEVNFEELTEQDNLLRETPQEVSCAGGACEL
jgi:ribonucleoside-diphosphate reductase alpha chain